MSVAEGRLKSVDDPVYGGQLQPLSIQGHQAEGKIHIDYAEAPVTLAGGKIVNLRKPHYQIEHLAYGPLDPQDHALAARRPADDRPRPFGTGAGGSNPRSCRPGRQER